MLIYYSKFVLASRSRARVHSRRTQLARQVQVCSLERVALACAQLDRLAAAPKVKQSRSPLAGHLLARPADSPKCGFKLARRASRFARRALRPARPICIGRARARLCARWPREGRRARRHQSSGRPIRKSCGRNNYHWPPLLRRRSPQSGQSASGATRAPPQWPN